MGLIQLPYCFNFECNPKKEWRGESAWECWCKRGQIAKGGSTACDGVRGHACLKKII